MVPTMYEKNEVWLARLEPVPDQQNSDQLGIPNPREVRGKRPVLILSSNCSLYPLLLVVPITTTDKKLPEHIEVPPSEGGLDERSFLMCNQFRPIDRERLEHRIGKLPRSSAREVETMVKHLMPF